MISKIRRLGVAQLAAEISEMKSLPEVDDAVDECDQDFLSHPLFGAFLADAYLGHYYTLTIFSTIYLPVNLLFHTCNSFHNEFLYNSLLFGILYSSIKSADGYLVLVVIHIASGSAGIKPCVSTFGADQFDSADPREKRQLASFFNWFYFAINLGILISISLVVYLSDYVSWGWGLGSLAIAMGLANLSFFLGTRFYCHCKLASGSPFTRVAQVLVASTRKWRQGLANDDAENLLSLHEVHDHNKQSAIIGSRKLHHTTSLRYLYTRMIPF
ncbi:unnamed protein product [Sphagnum troendelagicum]|uniref:Uncharacterized protein n=1 Tax=Sphagnum troendelagicum TaxID=128251 RepID=A0ABP0TV86_9BRYO